MFLLTMESSGDDIRGESWHNASYTSVASVAFPVVVSASALSILNANVFAAPSLCVAGSHEVASPEVLAILDLFLEVDEVDSAETRLIVLRDHKGRVSDSQTYSVESISWNEWGIETQGGLYPNR